jgi:hypothetical protein
MLHAGPADAIEGGKSVLAKFQAEIKINEISH